MATFNPSTSDPSVVKTWSRYISLQIPKRTLLFNPDHGLCGPTEDYAIQKIKDFAQTDAGDKVTFTLLHQFSKKPTVGDNTLEGHEENLKTSTDSLTLDVLRHGIMVSNPMTNQRLNFKAMKRGADMLADWGATIFEIASHIHLCSFSATSAASNYSMNGTNIDPSDVAWTANYAPRAPSTNQIIRGGSSLTTDQAVGADNTAKMTADLVTEAVYKAKTQDNPIRPLMVNGRGYFGCLVHPRQMKDLKATGSDFRALLSDAMEGGFIHNNPLFTGSNGVVDGVIFFESPWVTPGVHSSTSAPVANTRRAVLFGAQALLVGHGKGYDKSPWEWWHGDKDHGHHHTASMRTLVGMKNPEHTFAGSQSSTKQDMGKIVITTYAED